MNPFKPAGFDNLLGKGLVITATEFKLPAGSTMVVDGDLTVDDILMIADQPTGGFLDKLRPTPDAMKTTLVINGKVNAGRQINVSNVTITGDLTVDVLICEGMLAVKSGAKVKATEIRYRSLTIEDGAAVLGQMSHLDHISAGEQV